MCLHRGLAGIVGQVPGPPAACLLRAAGPREKFMRATRTAAAAVLRRHGRCLRDARTRAAPRPFSCANRRPQGAVVVLPGGKGRLRSQAGNPGAAYLAQCFGDEPITSLRQRPARSTLTQRRRYPDHDASADLTSCANLASHAPAPAFDRMHAHRAAPRPGHLLSEPSTTHDQDCPHHRRNRPGRCLPG